LALKDTALDTIAEDDYESSNESNDGSCNDGEEDGGGCEDRWSKGDGGDEDRARTLSSDTAGMRRSISDSALDVRWAADRFRLHQFSIFILLTDTLTNLGITQFLSHFYPNRHPTSASAGSLS